MCTPADGNYTVTYTPSSSNPQGCPSPMTQMVTWPDDAGDPFAGCTCAGSTQTCMMQDVSDAGTLTETDTYTFTATGFSGTIVATESGVTCNYTFTGTM